MSAEPETMTAKPTEVVDEAAMAAALRRISGRIVLCGHEHPDGDAIGATFGLCHALRASGRDAVCWGVAPIPRMYSYLEEDALPGMNVPLEAFEPMPDDTIIVLDCGVEDRVYPPIRPWLSRCPVLCMDHHKSSTGLQGPFLLEPEAGSVSEVVYRVAKAAGLTITRAAAEAFWTGIITDTGRFMYAGASGDTLRAAAELRELGVRNDVIGERVFGKRPLKSLLLERRMFASLRVSEDGRVAMGGLRAEDYAAEQCTAEHSENFVDIVRTIDGCEIVAFVRQIKPGGPAHVSLRTTDAIDASAICVEWGGGGHARAAGATLNLSYEAAFEAVYERMRQAVAAIPAP